MVYRGRRYGDMRNGNLIPDEETEIITRKNRDGVVGTIFMNFYGQYNLFEEMTDHQIEAMKEEEDDF